MEATEQTTEVDGQDFYTFLEDSIRLSDIQDASESKSKVDLKTDLEEEEEEDKVEVEELDEQSMESEKKALEEKKQVTVKDEIVQVAVASVTTRMRQFWVNLIEQESKDPKLRTTSEAEFKKIKPPTSPTKLPLTSQSTPQLNRESHGFTRSSTMSDPKPSQLSTSQKSPASSPESSSPPPISRGGHRTISEALMKKEGTKPTREEEEEIKKIQRAGSSPRFSRHFIRKSHDFDNRKLYTVRERKLVRKTWQEMEQSMANSQPTKDSVLGSPFVGFRLELGTPLGRNSKIELEDPDKYEPWYKNHFFGKEHFNYIGLTEKMDPVIISIVQNKEDRGEQSFMALIRTPKSDKKVEMIRRESTAGKNTVKKNLAKELRGAFSYLSKTKLKLTDSPKLPEALLHYEKQQVISSAKIGVLYCKEGQTNEEDMFSNTVPSENFTEFLDFLGDTITLKGFKGFRGGLDVRGDSTGTHSLATKFRSVEIMFHVSTLLPFSKQDLQQVERKRHLGNDIVVIIFVDGKVSFSPQTITSEFNHIYTVIQPLEPSKKGISRYRVGFAAKDGVPPFGPLLPHPAIFEKNDSFREWLFIKILNAEVAAISEGRQFAPKVIRTRKALLEALAKEHKKNH